MDAERERDGVTWPLTVAERGWITALRMGFIGKPLRWGLAPGPTRGCPPLDPDQGQPWTSGHRLREAQSMRGNCL